MPRCQEWQRAGQWRRPCVRSLSKALSGITQVICDPERSPEAHRAASEVRSEYVVQVRGTVVNRLPGTENPHLSTGEIEIAAEEILTLNPARTTPFPISDRSEERRVGKECR